VRQSLLIVDDDARFRSTARALLEREGYDVVGEAATGTEAIALVGRHAPAIVLLDIRLPDVDGFEVAERLAELARPPVVVLISSRDRGDYGSLVDDSSAHAFLSKADLSGESLAAAAGSP
jgi:DNA-binding NarL/FixJ family response regulator